MVEAHPLNRVTQLVTYDPDLMDEDYTQYVWSYVTPGKFSNNFKKMYDYDCRFHFSITHAFR